MMKGLIKQKSTAPVMMGELRHIYTLIGTIILGLGITSPDWLPVIVSEQFTNALFIVIGSVIDLVQMLRSIFAVEKSTVAGVKFLGITIPPELAGTIRQLLTMLGTMLVMLNVNAPTWVYSVLSEEGVTMLFDAIGSLITYFSFVLSRKSKEKQISEIQYAALKKEAA